MALFVDTLIVSTTERPDLVPVVAQWLWTAFGRSAGRSLEQALDAVGNSVKARPMPKTLILLADGEPVGTASLVAHDLEERPDLTPWLAGVFVEPAVRRRGYASRLVAAVEQAARAERIATLWLYTNTAERLYARAGWLAVGTLEHNGRPFALMRRDLRLE